MAKIKNKNDKRTFQKKIGKGHSIERQSLVYRQPRAIRYPGSQLSRICAKDAKDIASTIILDSQGFRLL